MLTTHYNKKKKKKEEVMNSACMHTRACWLRSPLVLRSALCPLCFYCTISGFYYRCALPPARGRGARAKAENKQKHMKRKFSGIL